MNKIFTRKYLSINKPAAKILSMHCLIVGITLNFQKQPQELNKETPT